MVEMYKRILTLFRNDFAKSTLLYGFSTAINKGLMLLSLPFLGKILTLEEYGVWALIQIIISLGAPVLSLNAFSAIVREGVGNSHKGFTVFCSYSKLTIMLIVILGLVIYLFCEDIIIFSFLLIGLEALQFCILGYYRSQDKHLLYFSVSLLKLVSLLISTILLWNEHNLILLIKYQFKIGFILLLFFYISCFIINRTKLIKLIGLNRILIFSILLIPHGISQWVLSGSDRIIIEWFLSDIELGKYSLAYSIAMSLMVLNSGLGLVMPNFIIRNYDKWIDGVLKSKVIIGYSFLTMILAIGMFLSLPYLGGIISIFKNISSSIGMMILTLYMGLYLLGIYYLYINVLFYHKKSKMISYVTIMSSILNVVLTIFMVIYIGVYGAALSTFISYLFYCGSSIYVARKIEPIISKNIKKELIIIVVSFLLIFSISSLIIYNY